MKRPGSRERPWNLKKARVSQPAMSDRPRDPFYHTTRWKKESRAFRQANPLCVECKKEGITSPAEITDHIIPKDICSDPWDQGNWQGLCKKHHAVKAVRDRQLIKKHRDELAKKAKD